ncbi:hypothetical protein D3C78_1495560 [compost metagenome]
MKYIAAWVFPVSCVNQPTTMVLKNPATLPSELIKAIAAAAAAPPTTAVGMPQNTGKLLIIAAVPTVRPIIDNNRLSPNNVPNTTPAPPMKAQIARCQRYSRSRSELRPTSTMLTVATE